MGQGMGDQSQMQGAYGGATGYDASSMGNRSGGRSSHQHGRTTMMERFVQGKYIRSDRPGRNSGAQSRRTERDEEKKRGFFVVSAHDDAVAQTGEFAENHVHYRRGRYVYILSFSYWNE